MNHQNKNRGMGSAALLVALTVIAAGCGGRELPPEGDAPSVATSTQGIAGMTFGTMCQQEFQNDWLGSLPNTWIRCGGFNSRFDDVATQSFYYSLGGAKPVWETTYSPWYLDSVSLFFASTHGGAWSGTAAYAMWDAYSHAFSKYMRLGTNLSILSTYSCQTLLPDAEIVTRWLPVLAGGLPIVTGSHGSLYASYWTDDIGEDYANNLANGWSVKDAWFDGLWDAWTPQDVAVLSDGRTASECYARKDGITAYNAQSQLRLRDGAIGYMCWTTLSE